MNARPALSMGVAAVSSIISTAFYTDSGLVVGKHPSILISVFCLANSVCVAACLWLFRITNDTSTIFTSPFTFQSLPSGWFVLASWQAFIVAEERKRPQMSCASPEVQPVLDGIAIAFKFAGIAPQILTASALQCIFRVGVTSSAPSWP